MAPTATTDLHEQHRPQHHAEPGRHRTPALGVAAAASRPGGSSSWKADKICGVLHLVISRLDDPARLYGDPARNGCVRLQRASNIFVRPSMSHNQFDKKSEAWSALFSEPMSDLVKRYTSSVFFDKRLWQADIAGFAWPMPRCWPPGHHLRGRTMPRSSAAWRRSRRRSSPAPVRMEARPRRRASQHRGTPDATGRRRRQAPAHRPQPQRPGRHRRAPVAARRDRPDCRPADSTCKRHWWKWPRRMWK